MNNLVMSRIYHYFAALLLINLIISKLVQRYMDHRSLQGLTE